MAGNVFPAPFMEEENDAIGDEVISVEESDSSDPLPPPAEAHSELRPLSLVRLTKACRDWFQRSGRNNSPLVQENAFIFLGEIPNMPAHCVVFGQKSGHIVSGYHIEDFEEIPEDET